MDIPYNDSLLHSRWINGLLYLRECNPEDDIRLIQTSASLLSVITAIALDNYQDVVSAMIASMGAALRLGYYLGQNGLDADAPIMSPEFAKRELEAIITPGCDCDSCQAKIDLLKEYGVDYEMTPERQELADTIEGSQVGKTVKGTIPPDDFDLSVN